MGEDFEELKARAEALLFAAGKPIPLRLIMNICGTRSRKTVLKVLEELKKSYENDGRALELLSLPGDRWFLKLRKEYMDLVKKYVKRSLFSRGVMRTLAFIAYHQPVQQSQVVAVRGNSAYKHIKLLLEKGLIESEKTGRTLTLKTSQLFADYFGVENTPSAIKRVISSHLKREEKERGKNPS